MITQDEYLCEFVVYGDWDHYEGCFWTNIDGEWTCVEFVGRHGEWWWKTKPKPSKGVIRAVTSMLKELEPGRWDAFIQHFDSWNPNLWLFSRMLP